MLTVALALGASLTWGVADFFGPLKARTFGALRVLVYAQLGGLVVIAPIAGVSAAVPVIVGIASGEHLSALTAAGITCALIGVFLASREPGRGGSHIAAGVGLALLAAVGFGCYFPPMHAAGNADFWWASLFFRTTSTTMIL